MTDVIPPATLYSIHPYEQYTAEQNNLWKQLFLILDQIYLRTGGTTDDTTSLSEKIESNENQIAWLVGVLNEAIDKANQALDNDLPVIQTVRDFDQVNVSSAYAAVDNQEVNATLSSVITLPTSGRIKVNNIDGSHIVVNLSGSQTIFGDTSVVIQSKGSVIFKYLVESDQWVFE